MVSEHMIAICGPKGSGKTTVAKILVQRYGYKELWFSYPLKQIARAFGFSNKCLYGSQLDKESKVPTLGISARCFLQKFGTEICRDVLPDVIPEMIGKHESIWVKLMDNKINKLLREDPGRKIVVSDLRFQDEYNMLKKKYGATVIRVSRLYPRPIDYHFSERGPDSPADIIVPNNRGIEDLEKIIINIMET